MHVYAQLSPFAVYLKLSHHFYLAMLQLTIQNKG